MSEYLEIPHWYQCKSKNSRILVFYFLDFILRSAMQAKKRKTTTIRNKAATSTPAPPKDIPRNADDVAILWHPVLLPQPYCALREYCTLINSLYEQLLMERYFNQFIQTGILCKTNKFQDPIFFSVRKLSKIIFWGVVCQVNKTVPVYAQPDQI